MKFMRIFTDPEKHRTTYEILTLDEMIAQRIAFHADRVATWSERTRMTRRLIDADISLPEGWPSVEKCDQELKYARCRQADKVEPRELAWARNALPGDWLEERMTGGVTQITTCIND